MNTLVKFLTLAATSLALGFGTLAIAADSVATYNMKSFDTAQTENQHIVVEVFKKGCPTCAAQQPGLNEAKAKFPGAKFVTVDFLGDQDAVKRFAAVKQSTIIVYKGNKEVARLVGETNNAAIVEAIGKGA
jgi:thioredoxin 1